MNDDQMLSEQEFAEALARIEAKLTLEERELLIISFSGAQVHGTWLYVLIGFVLGAISGAAVFSLV